MHHYEIYHSRTTFFEFLRLTYPHRIQGALMWLPLRMGIICWRPQTMSFPDSIRELAVDMEDLPEPARRYMADASASLADHGFVDR